MTDTKITLPAPGSARERMARAAMLAHFGDIFGNGMPNNPDQPYGWNSAGEFVPGGEGGETRPTAWAWFLPVVDAIFAEARTPIVRDRLIRAVGGHYDGSADPVETPNNWARAAEAVDAVLAEMQSSAPPPRKPGHYWVRDESGWAVAVWEESAGIWGWAYPGVERPLNDESFDEIRETPIDPPA